jgi:hypothetical protein
MLKLNRHPGIQLEVKHIPQTRRLAWGCSPRLPVFLHEGLGSVSLWKNFPEQVCETLGCEGWVYSRQGYGKSEGTPDIQALDAFVLITCTKKR